MKKCRTCKEEKDESEFYSGYPDCKSCVSVKRRKRLVTDPSYYINNKYDSIKHRVEAWYPYYPSSAQGMPLLTREEFLAWVEETREVFDEMWAAFVGNGAEQGMAPSVDRIDPKRGYEIGNIQWLTQRDNASKGNR